MMPLSYGNILVLVSDNSRVYDKTKFQHASRSVKLYTKV